MGTVDTDRVLNRAWTIENHGMPGGFALLSRDPVNAITITLEGPGKAETIVLAHAGDSCSFSMLGLDFVKVESAAYPSSVLVDYTTMEIDLAAAPILSNIAGSPLSVIFSGFTAIKQSVVTVGIAAVALTGGLANRKSLLIQADAANTANIYVGSATVTADATATGGIILTPGSSLPIDAGSAVVSGISTIAAQKVRILEAA